MTDSESTEHQNSLFGDLDTQETTPKPKQRSTRQSQRIIEVDPASCTLWGGNPRNIARVDQTSLDELSTSMETVGQTVPVIARKVSDQLQVIVGCRRWLAAKEIRSKDPNFKLRAEVRSLTDEQAFTLVHSENDNRRELSVFETASLMMNALNDHYDGKQVDLAKRIGKSKTWVSRYVQIAINLSDYYELFSDWPKVSFRQASELADYVEKNSGATLESFKAIRDLDRQLTMAEIMTRVVKPTSPKAQSRLKKQYGPAKKPHLVVNKHSAQRLTISIPRYDSMNNESIENAFKTCLEEWQKT